MFDRSLLPEHLIAPDANRYFSDNYVVLDFETTNLQYGNSNIRDNKLLLGVWYDNTTGISKSAWGGELEQHDLVMACERADFIVAHNAKMELGWLLRMGADLTKIVVFDTMIAEYVLRGNERPFGLGLGEVAPHYGYGTKDPFFDTSVRAGVCPSDMPRSFVGRRCRKDVWQTYSIFKEQLVALSGSGKLSTFYTHCLLTPVLADIESRGMHLDPEMTTDTYENAVDGFNQLAGELAVITGGINLRSPKQKQELLFDVMGFKRPKDHRGEEITSTDHAAMMALKCTNKKQREFLNKYFEYTNVASLISKNLTFFKGVTDEHDGIFHGLFNQTVTKTHRLSASGLPIKFGNSKKANSVQFQNMPRSLKRLFCSRKVNEGWLMGESDGAQLEFRVAGFMGQDEVAYDSIANGEDVHAFTASVLTANGQPTERQEAKAHTFKPLYGGQSGTKAEQAYYTAFKQKYLGIARAQESWKSEVLKTKQLLLPTGLRFYWPDTRITNTGYITNSTNICNYPVQYLATGEIIPIGLVFMWHWIKLLKLESFIVNTIHDSIASEVHPEEQEIMLQLGQRSLTDDVYTYLHDVYGIKFNFPLGTGSKMSRNWSLTKDEVKFESAPPFEFKRA